MMEFWPGWTSEEGHGGRIEEFTVEYKFEMLHITGEFGQERQRNPERYVAAGEPS